jgi:hypothetical protein
MKQKLTTEQTKELKAIYTNYYSGVLRSLKKRWYLIIASFIPMTLSIMFAENSPKVIILSICISSASLIGLLFYDNRIILRKMREVTGKKAPRTKKQLVLTFVRHATIFIVSYFGSKYVIQIISKLN